jgi:hypothetical protein
VSLAQRANSREVVGKVMYGSGEEINTFHAGGGVDQVEGNPSF